MNKLLTMLLAGIVMCFSSVAFAAGTEDVPPAHQQKKQVPDTTKSGDYLQTQQDNNNGNNAQQNQGSGSKPSKPGSNMEKSKRFHEDPAEGGTDVNQPKR